MKKRYFWAIDLTPPSDLHRFPSQRQRDEWIAEKPRQRGKVGTEHPAVFAVRRVNRQLSAGEVVEFPVMLEE